MSHSLKLSFSLLIIAGLVFTSCNESSLTSPSADNTVPPGNVLSATNSNPNLNNIRDINLNGLDDMDDINPMLAERGLNIRLAYAETVTSYDGGQNSKATKKDGKQEVGGQTIFANDRAKRLGAQWVPGDERRLADGNNLTYLTWVPFAPANFGTPDQFDGTPAIDASMDTWNNVKKNGKLDIVRRPSTLVNPSAILLFGDPFQADISEVGFLPGGIFDDFLGPGASSSVLGVTFTFVFIDDDGNPTDINNDGYDDVAIKEVWYNDNFLWTDQGDANTGTDVETVALHENGHALGFGHFGKIFITNGNGKLHVAPRAVMNAIILGEQRNLLGTDKGSYNSVYGNWPRN